MLDGMAFQILVVCTGNICRSPMGEIVLREQFARAGIGEPEVRVRSAGVSSEEQGNRVDWRARKVLGEAGYPQRRKGAAHRVTVTELQESDLILAMTASHQRALARMAEAAGVDPAKIRMWRDGDMPDPWYGDMSDFRATMQAIEAGAELIVRDYLDAK